MLFQVLITAGAFNLALRDIAPALEIDPLHSKTVLRRAHCLEKEEPERSLTDLDLLLHMSVPDKLVNDRRSHLFLKSLIKEGTKDDHEEEEQEDPEESDVAIVQGEEHQLASLPMGVLMDLGLEELRELDGRVGRWQRQRDRRRGKEQ